MAQGKVSQGKLVEREIAQRRLVQGKLSQGKSSQAKLSQGKIKPPRFQTALKFSAKPGFSFRDLMRQESGAATAEYVLTIMAAVGFAGLLVAILRGDEIKALLSELVKDALQF